MIKFSLVCEEGHVFESWFASGAAYDQQAERGHVDCPVCGTGKVTKAIMAPAIASGRGRLIEGEFVEGQAAGEQAIKGEVLPPLIPGSGETSAPVLLDERLIAIRSMMGAMRAEILANTIDVGASFPKEVRKMQDGETPERPIRGEATVEEARALIEEGVTIMPIPAAPEDWN